MPFRGLGMPLGGGGDNIFGNLPPRIIDRMP